MTDADAAFSAEQLEQVNQHYAHEVQHNLYG
jgi:hypothetical protein